MLKGKKIVVGVTGSIAAYKTAVLVRLLVKEGAHVRVLMTDAAKEFITPLTLATLSKNPVVSSFTKGDMGEWNNHVEIANWADLLLIAPASADTLARMAHGTCDNVLLAVYLSASCPVVVAPAMDLEMYRHATTVTNLKTLAENGNTILPAAKGELASGLLGEGRMQEPEEIVAFVKKKFDHKLPLTGVKAMVTAGPTQEPIDAVRYISNRSSGKMGLALARELSRQGAEVTLISGPIALEPDEGIRTIQIETAAEMHTACMKIFSGQKLVLMAAAVADYTPIKPATHKLKKKDNNTAIELKPTTDILAEMGSKKKKSQVLVGFALETNDEMANAKSKRKNKNLDMIVLNSLNDQGAGFGHNTNKISIIDHKNRITTFELKPKNQVASDIVDKIIQEYFS